jgi:hypothetical protein
MRTARLLAALPLLLAAAPAPPLAPGLWQETLVYALDSVNGSEEMGARMQDSLPSPQPRRTCYTVADLADPRAMFLAGAEGSCHFSRFTMNDGTIDAIGDCADGHGQSMHVVGTGHYSPAGYDFDFTGTGRAGKLDLAFRGRDSGRRIGMCQAPQG